LNYPILNDTDFEDKNKLKEIEEDIKTKAIHKVKQQNQDRLKFLVDWNILRKKNDEFIRKLQQDQRDKEDKKKEEDKIEYSSNDINNRIISDITTPNKTVDINSLNNTHDGKLFTDTKKSNIHADTIKTEFNDRLQTKNKESNE